MAIDKLLLVSFSLSLHQQLNISFLLSFAGVSDPQLHACMLLQIPGWWRVNLVSQHVVTKGCKVSPLQSSSHSCWAAKKAGYQHGKEEEDEEAAAAEETLAGYFVKS
jgi:hypothetical protein